MFIVFGLMTSELISIAIAPAMVVEPVPPLLTGSVPETLETGNVPLSEAAVIDCALTAPSILASPTTWSAASGFGVLIPTFFFRSATSGVPWGTVKYRLTEESVFN